MNLNIKSYANTTNATNSSIHWTQQIKNKLIKQNREKIAKQPPIQLPRSNRMWNVFTSGKVLTEKHNYTITESGQGPYSQYIQISSNQNIPNQLTLCFPYLKHLADKNSQKYQDQIYSISERVTNKDNYKQWQLVCRDYAPPLDIFELIRAFLNLLAYGTSTISTLAKQIQCKKAPLFYKVMEMRRYFSSSNQKIAHQNLSIQNGESINLQNLSKGVKCLFCPICLLYDCTKHQISSNLAGQNYQYIQKYCKQQKLIQRKDSVIQILSQTFKILNQNQNIKNQSSCSDTCYKNLNRSGWKILCKQRTNKRFSPIFVAIIALGTQMFCYCPCKIATLFVKSSPKQNKPNSQGPIKCSEIFYYFLNEFSLNGKLQLKYYHSELKYLENESKQSLRPENKRKVNKKKNKKPNRTKKQQNQSFNSICFHFFLENEPQDMQCLSCDCQKRGYCLPQCQCSDQCTIPLKGCSCKSGECLSTCTCYKQRRACIPQLCSNCFKNEWQVQQNNCCQNNQLIYDHPKLTKIGTSTIPNAGLGLFAGETIYRGQFVIKYLGELVESQSLLKMRENLTKQGLFYTFKLNQHQSIDSRHFGNKSRFINHSKIRENVKPQVIKIKEQEMLIFRAIKDIRENQQILFNYNGNGDLSELKQKLFFIE